MEVILRPATDPFLEGVVFPALALGAVDVAPALEHLLRAIEDEETRVLLELVLDAHGGAPLAALDDERWSQALSRLLFHDWFLDTEGWQVGPPHPAFAGPWEATLQLALMLEDPAFPYDDEARAAPLRRAAWEEPRAQLELSATLCGLWAPPPAFPPHHLLTAAGRGAWAPAAGLARADWAWRPMLTVAQWAAHLPSALSRLLDREVRRLAPLAPPERHELLAYWLGHAPRPPVLATCFSGLGPQAMDWIRDLGELARVVRAAAAAERGLTAVIASAPRERHRGL